MTDANRTFSLGHSLPLPQKGSGGETVEEAVGRAKVDSVRTDTKLRVFMVLVLASIFAFLNWQVMAFINRALAEDLALLKTNPAYVRIVTEQVLMTLIGATAVQVGAGIVVIVSYLFPKGRAGDD